MPRLKTRVPKLSRHTRGGAFVTIDGRRVWLGRYGDPVTSEKYDRLVAEWLAHGRSLPGAARSDEDEDHEVTVTEIVVRYYRWAKGRYGTAGVSSVKTSLKILRRLYGSVVACDFGPKKLRVVREQMVEKGWTRKSVNRQVSRLRSVFKWAASHEIVPFEVYHRLTTIEPLRPGEVEESERVMPVSRAHIRRVRRHLAKPVRALIDLQLLTGARGGEIVGLRSCDLDRSKAVWVYRPKRHKTAHHGQERVIYFGPMAQRIIRLFEGSGAPDSDRILFSPREGNAELKQRAANGRRRPGQKPNPRKTTRKMGEGYTTGSYRRAIHRACGTEKIPVWGPHRLRHNAATTLRHRFGIEIAKTVLGHRTIQMTETYAERDHRKAADAIGKVG